MQIDPTKLIGEITDYDKKHALEATPKKVGAKEPALLQAVLAVL